MKRETSNVSTDDLLGDFEGETYLNLMTFRENGAGVATPVWFVRDSGTRDGDTLYVRTVADSWKVKRLRRSSRARVMPCGREGQPRGDWLDAEAVINTDPATADRVRRLVAEKYGLDQATYEREENGRVLNLPYTIIEIHLTETMTKM